MAGDFVTIQIEGLRDALGRFVRMGSGELKAIQIEEAEGLATVLQTIYRGVAPKGTGLNRYAEEGGPFYQSIKGEVVLGKGLSLMVYTTQGKKRKWLKEGTGIHGPLGSRIYPKGGALSFFWQGAHVTVASVEGMRPNPWEKEAEARARPVIAERMKAVGARIVRELVTGPVD